MPGEETLHFGSSALFTTSTKICKLCEAKSSKANLYSGSLREPNEHGRNDQYDFTEPLDSDRWKHYPNQSNPLDTYGLIASDLAC